MQPFPEYPEMIEVYVNGQKLVGVNSWELKRGGFQELPRIVIDACYIAEEPSIDVAELEAQRREDSLLAAWQVVEVR